jgi:hypothetical protein
MNNVPTDLILSSPEEAAEKLACYKLISQRSGGLVKDAGLSDWWSKSVQPVVSDYWSRYKNALSGGAGQGTQLATLAGTGAAGFGLLGLLREATREKKRRNLMNAFYPAIMGGLAGLGGGMAWQNLPQLREGVSDLFNPEPPDVPPQSATAKFLEETPVTSIFARARRAYNEGGAGAMVDTLTDPKEWLTGGTEASTFPGGSIGAGGAMTAGGVLTPTVLKALRSTDFQAGIGAQGNLGLDPHQQNALKDWLQANVKSPAGTTRAGRRAMRHGLSWHAPTGRWTLPMADAVARSRPSLATGTTPQPVLDAFGLRIEGRRPMSLAERALRHPIQAGRRAGATVGDWAAEAGLPTGQASVARRTTSRPGPTRHGGPGLSPTQLRNIRTSGRQAIPRLGGRALGWASLVPLLFGIGNEALNTKPIPE